jgi:hypothetical protein
MVVNGASRRGVEFWAKHLANDKKNDRAELKEIRGLAADNLKDALLEMQEDARHTRCQNFFYQANFNPSPNERLTEEQWERAFEIFEKNRGIPEGTARIVYEHEKEGRIHRHVIWSRIDLENMRAWSDALDAKVCHTASREISEELGLERTPSPYDKDREGPRPERAPKPYEMFRGLRSGFDPRNIKSEVTAIFRESETPWEFRKGLRELGYVLVQGDRRDFCILDPAGEVHSLARRIDGVNAKELRTFMEGIDRDELPTVQQAKTKHADRVLHERQDELTSIQREISWEERLAQSALEKEEIERRFVEPNASEVRRREEAEGTWPMTPPSSEPTTTSPAYHFEDAARQIADAKKRPVMPLTMKGTRALIWEAYRSSDTPEAFTAALDKDNILLARVTKDDVDRSHREATFAREIGTYAPRYREREIVAVTALGHIYRLTERTTGHEIKEINRFLKPLDRGQIQGIEATRELQSARTEERNIEIQAFRDLLRDSNIEKREQRSRQTPWGASGFSKKSTPVRKAGKALNRAVGKTERVGGAAVDFVLGGANALADAFSSLFDVPIASSNGAERDAPNPHTEAQPENIRPREDSSRDR